MFGRLYVSRVLQKAQLISHADSSSMLEHVRPRLALFVVRDVWSTLLLRLEGRKQTLQVVVETAIDHLFSGGLLTTRFVPWSGR